MRRFATTLLAGALAASLVLSVGCQPKVEVKTGTRVICTYGEVISDSTRTVKVPKNESGSYRVSTETTTCDRHQKLDALYEAAQSDIETGNLTAAAAKLTQVVAGDPTFAKAKEQLDQIAAKKKPTPDRRRSTGGTTTAPGTTPVTPPPVVTEPTGPIESLLQWAPDVIPGYATAAKAGSDSLTISREYVPSKGSNVAGFVIVAEQFRDSAGAGEGLKRQVKQAYTRDSATVAINGHQAYFGTDGRRFAALGFTSGAVMVALEMSAKSGAPLDLKNDLIAAAKALP